MLIVRQSNRKKIFFTVELGQDGKTCFFALNLGKMNDKIKNRKKSLEPRYKEEI